ncbi:hypothetical protein ACEQUB_p00558 (plasmid) [Ralstonia syzygii]
MSWKESLFGDADMWSAFSVSQASASGSLSYSGVKSPFGNCPIGTESYGARA